MAQSKLQGSNGPPTTTGNQQTNPPRIQPADFQSKSTPTDAAIEQTTALAKDSQYSKPEHLSKLVLHD